MHNGIDDGHHIMTSHHRNTNLDMINFKESVSPICGCRLETESNQHLFLCCHFYHVERLELLNISCLYNIDVAINELNGDSIINLVLFGSDKYHKETNRKVLLSCITYLKATKRFDEPLL